MLSPEERVKHASDYLDVQIAATLTAAQWTQVFNFLYDAREKNVEDGYRCIADEALELRQILRDQIDPRREKAYEQFNAAYDAEKEASAIEQQFANAGVDA